MYDLHQHRYRFASWTSSTAAGTSPKCRFKVFIGIQIINASRLKEASKSWNNLPEPEGFNEWHREVRNELIKAASDLGVEGFTHGVAAKMLNVFLKTICTVDVKADQLSHEEVRKLNCIHPPIDRILAKALLASNDKRVSERRHIWSEIIYKGGWSALDSDTYESIIAEIDETTNGCLWKIEEFWKGHQ